MERAIAAILGGERVPVTGRTMGSAPDIAHHRYALEVKHGHQIPRLLIKAMAQAIAAADHYRKRMEGDRIPMVVLHPHGAPYTDSLIVIRISDLERLQSQGEAS